MNSNTTDLRLTESPESQVISFVPIYEAHFSHAFSLIVSIPSTIITLPLIYGIIWFEKNNHQRTLINQLVTSICCYHIGWVCFIYINIGIHLTLGTTGPFLCALEIIFQNVVGMQTIFLLEAIVVTKYTFVYFLKNPVAIHDEFFQFFINISTLMLSFLSQSVYMRMPGRNPTSYYICMGSFPLSQLPNPVKPNLPYFSLMILSTFTHMITALKMRMAKETVVVPATQTPFSNNHVENNQDILANLNSNIISMIWISIAGCVTYLYNELSPENLNMFPNYLIVFFCHLWLPQVLSYATIIVYYRSHKNLQATVWKEIVARIPWVQK